MRRCDYRLHHHHFEQASSKNALGKRKYKPSGHYISPRTKAPWQKSPRTEAPSRSLVRWDKIPRQKSRYVVSCNSCNTNLPVYVWQAVMPIAWVVSFFCSWIALIRFQLALVNAWRKFNAEQLVQGLEYKQYDERLKLLGITSLQKRRIRGDLIQDFRIVKGLTHDFGTFFELDNGGGHEPRGQIWKLKVNRCRLQVRRCFFNQKIISEWNNKLPASGWLYISLRPKF